MALIERRLGGVLIVGLSATESGAQKAMNRLSSPPSKARRKAGKRSELTVLGKWRRL